MYRHSTGTRTRTRTKTRTKAPNLILFNKPYGVLTQFTGPSPNLSDFIADRGYYPAGRLDKDSEGLLLLTNNGKLQARIANPKFKMDKCYWAQVEGDVTDAAISLLSQGVELNDGQTRPAQVSRISCPLPRRSPDIRSRKNVSTSWLQLVIREGRNRQVRRMTANVGFPTLRLYRHAVGPWQIETLAPGEYRHENVNL